MIYGDAVTWIASVTTIPINLNGILLHSQLLVDM
jgi:hypothetical protein